MKKHSCTLCLIFCLCLSLSLLSSCKKNAATVSETTKPEGQSIGSSGNTDDGSLTEDDLLGNAGKDDFNLMGAQSDEYKKMYGRSSKPLLPIFFDFDDSGITAEQGDRLQKNAQYMIENPAVNVVIEGNCDDRGTSDYNLALGEKRAQSAKAYLMQLGIEENRLRTKSFGEERPLFPTKGEASWAENRRDDFVIEE